MQFFALYYSPYIEKNEMALKFSSFIGKVLHFVCNVFSQAADQHLRYSIHVYSFGGLFYPKQLNTETDFSYTFKLLTQKAEVLPDNQQTRNIYNWWRSDSENHN